MLVAIGSSQLAARVQAQAELASRSASQNSALAGFARNLTGLTDKIALGQVLTSEAARMLDVNAIFVMPGEIRPTVSGSCPPGGTLAPIDEAAASWAFVFETFARLEDSDRTGGTGLGLTIVRGFAEAMGLSVSAANRDGEAGAKFTLTFPETLVVKTRGGA